eukprot:TRINITY_DN21700_c0_g1_i1.p1 TRINITY_DN21700_c0_g1~~TRINITY_DN21700_c0_g1_i1.p1  ORF type:complete len:707 (+),score=208.68 TRINITY_DN21700_c0_g1_i1:58-2121(+)
MATAAAARVTRPAARALHGLRATLSRQCRHSVATRGRQPVSQKISGRGDPKQWVDDTSTQVPKTAHWGQFTVPEFDYRAERHEQSTFMGVDLGTTNSCCCYISDGMPVVIPNAEGKRTTPTVVVLSGQNERWFGNKGYGIAVNQPGLTMCSGKRLLGKQLWDRRVPHRVYEETMQLRQTDQGIALVLPRAFPDQRDPENSELIFPVVHVMAMFMRHLKVTSETRLRQNLTSCVVAVPAHFNDAQRKATEDAAVVAGLDVLEIIDEPSAAALAYSVMVKDTRFGRMDKANLVVFDLGGGTFDMAVLHMDFGQQRSKILATGGDDLLGGDDFDRTITDHWDVRLPQNVMQQMRPMYRKKVQRFAEECKIALDTQEEYSASFVALPETGLQRMQVNLHLTRFEYEEMIEPLLQRLDDVISSVMAKSGLDPKTDVHDVLLVGEMTRTPAILKVIRKRFAQEPLHSDVASPGTVVAMGAAIRADMISKLMAGTPLSELPRITFDEGSLQYEKHLSGTRLLVHRLKKRAREWWARLTTRRRAREHVAERRCRLKMEQGLTEAEISEMSEELVNTEVAMNKAAMVEKCIDEAETLLIDLSAWLEPRRGLRDDQLVEMMELLKFWLNVCRDKKRGEEQLAQAMWELKFYFDELSGGKSTGPVSADDLADPEKRDKLLDSKQLPGAEGPLVVAPRG